MLRFAVTEGCDDVTKGHERFVNEDTFFEGLALGACLRAALRTLHKSISRSVPHQGIKSFKHWIRLLLTAKSTKLSLPAVIACWPSFITAVSR